MLLPVCGVNGLGLVVVVLFYCVVHCVLRPLLIVMCVYWVRCVTVFWVGLQLKGSLQSSGVRGTYYPRNKLDCVTSWPDATISIIQWDNNRTYKVHKVTDLDK